MTIGLEFYSGALHKSCYSLENLGKLKMYQISIKKLDIECIYIYTNRLKRNPTPCSNFKILNYCKTSLFYKN